MHAILHVSCLCIARFIEGCLTAPYCQPGIKEPLVFSCDAPQHLSHLHWCPTKCFAKFRFLGPLMPSEGDAENSTIGAVLGGRAGWNVLDWVMANYRSEFFSAVALQHHCYTLEAEKSVSGALQVFIFLLLNTQLQDCSCGESCRHVCQLSNRQDENELSELYCYLFLSLSRFKFFCTSCS